MTISRNSNELKQLIFAVLNTDTTLRTLLGGTGKVVHANPIQLSQYPCVVYDIINETDEFYDASNPTGITATRLMISLFSIATSSAEVDGIADRVFQLLHGQNLSNTNLLVYTAYRTSSANFYEPEIQVWRIEQRYDLVNAIH